MRILLRHLLVSCLLLAGGLVQAAPPAATPVPAADFFRHPDFADARLSPDGLTVAMLVRDKEDKVVLAVMPTGGGPSRVLASHADRDIINVHWVNNHRLVYSIHDGKLARGQTFVGAGLYAIDTDGGRHVQLVTHNASLANHFSHGVPLMEWNTAFLTTVHDNQSDDIFVLHGTDRKNDQFTEYTAYRMNTANGNSVGVPGPAHATAWLFDDAGVARFVTTHSEGRTAVLVHEGEAWRTLGEFSLDKGMGFRPQLLTADGKLFVLAHHGQDTEGLYEYDVANNRIADRPVIGLKQYDFRGALIVGADRQSLIGVRYETSEDVTTWFDEGMQQIQHRVDALLPATINRIELSANANAGVMLVHSYSDTDPGFWQLYHPASNSFIRLGATLPGIDPLRMANKTMLRYAARDGLEIPAYLTLPKDGGGKNLPLVVLVHGGPWSRGGHLDWEPEVQFLASRGYAVLQPEFRGSTGFGKAFFRAGWKQWGLAMQDDVSDGARWAIAQGIADPARVCIAGGSYGGYATLAGLIREPALFRCGIDWAGPTDIDLMYSIHWSDTSNEFKQYGMPVLIGDREGDAAQLKATSPLRNAAALHQPLLLAYGGADRRVPLAHGSRFYAAVKETNPDVEWIEYTVEGHGWRLPATNVDFWTRVERFLDKNIGKPSR